MRKLGIVAAALLCLTSATFAHAGAPGEITFGLEGGVGIPMGDFGKAFKSGFTGGAFGDYGVTNVVAVGIDGSWQRVKEKDVPFDVVVVDEFGTPALAGTVSDWKAEIIQVGAHVKLAPPIEGMALSPYLQLGAGLYVLRNEVTGDVPELSSHDSRSKLGFDLGIGADYRVTPAVGVGAFGAWHSISNAFEASGGTDRRSASYFALGVKVTFSTAARAAGGARTR